MAFLKTNNREAHWALMHGQADGDEFGAFMAAMYGGETGGGGGGWGGTPSSGDAVGGDGGGDVVAQENGMEYQGGYNLSENIGILGGFYVSYSYVVKEVGGSKLLASVFASAWAPYIEQVADKILYSGNVTIYDENGEAVQRIQLEEDFLQHNSDIGIDDFTFIGEANANIKQGYSLKLYVSYQATMNWQGSFSSSGFTHWFYF